uniref:Uncharacterized protein n=1 Tax=Arundo donax TaxID=35708 RepID=A0A0A9DFZ3_ARUDO
MVKRTTFTEQMVCHSGPSNLHYCTRSWEKDGIKAAPPVDGGGCSQVRLWSTRHLQWWLGTRAEPIGSGAAVDRPCGGGD